MASERVQRHIERLLDEADEAALKKDWVLVLDRAEHVLTFDPEHRDALALRDAAKRGLQTRHEERGTRNESPRPPRTSDLEPRAFCDGRYKVIRFLGEGGKKRVYLCHDTRLDRDVAFALIKTEGLDQEGLDRITREAQAMGKLGDHPHIVPVFDIGEESPGQPYIVTQFMPGGDVEGLLQNASDHKLPLEDAIRIAGQVCLALAHAHAHDIVHRDLKPGNVWLTDAGTRQERGTRPPDSSPMPHTSSLTAKLGDFGLAVALDRSRLTQAGMMVGTVAYMPPEQAMGGDVTFRSDLYSLGCMLYELVCGRPPFLGDESVAIITQHLNTPPVAPSWHRQDCPPGLEALILRLLEKDAGKRPGSAGEVRRSLESLVSGLESGGGVELQTRDQRLETNPLYRPTFVGREQELRQLQAAFDAALSGQGALAAVVGEPGIGKTALCEQLATYATLRGGKALVGHCYEEGSLSLPYLAFVEALRSYVLSREPAELKQDLGSNAGDVARIVSEVRERADVEPRPSAGDPEEDRWRLLEAVAGFLRNASSVRPLLLVLEDLHWADRGTLELLQHLARNLGGARLLVVGTYRDVEVDRTHPLSSTLAELRRATSFQRIPLRGLTVDEVHRMMNIIRGQEVPWGRAEAIHRQTEGNPLFVQEVLRYLVEEGLVVREGGRYVRADGGDPDSGIPEGLRDVIGKRLSRLSEKANQVLAVAAVIGREFRLDVLQGVAGLADEELYGALEEASERAILEHRSAVGAVGFRFTHAFFRQTLYEEIFPPRRIRLHQQVARALEATYSAPHPTSPTQPGAAVPQRTAEHAAEMAEHFIQSTDREDLDKALKYSRLAADRALAVYAYGEAVRHLQQGLQVQEVLDPDDKAQRCDLLLALAEALIPAGEPERAFRAIAEEAYHLAAGDLTDDERASRACGSALDAMFQFAGSTAGGTGSERYRTWAERADRHARPGSLARVRADMALATVLRQTGLEHEGWLKRLAAFETARSLDDPKGVLVTGGAIANGSVAPVAEHGRRLDAAEALWQHGLTSGSASATVLAAVGAVAAFLTWADRVRAGEILRRLEAIAERSRDPDARLHALGVRGLFATWEGALEHAVELADDIVRQGEEAGRPAGGRQWGGQARRRALLYLGRSDEALAGIPQPAHLWAVGGVLAAQRAIYLGHVGQETAAREVIDQFLASRDLSASDDHTPATFLRYLLEAAVAARHREAAAVLEPRLAPLAGLLFTEPLLTNCMGRDLGGAARLLGDLEKARTYYQQGIEACTKGRHRPELALTRLELAELLLEEAVSYQQSALSAPTAGPAGEEGKRAADKLKAEGLQHLDFAIAEFRDMKMQPSLERALKHKGLLTA